MNPDILQRLAEKEHVTATATPVRINVCAAASCQSRGSDELAKNLQRQIKGAKQAKQCKVRYVGCMGLCSKGPLVEIDEPARPAIHEADRRLLQGATVDDAPELIDLALHGARPTPLELDTDMPFFTRQRRVVLENSGFIDPERIEDYVARGGYQGLVKALTEMSPSQVIDEVSRSGLRGRGGAGFPTGVKWATVAKSDGSPKYVVCNADEGDPGAFMDRAVLESDPHRVLEGIITAGYAVGASRAYIYVRSEYPLAILRLKRAINQAKRIDVLGTNLCDTPFAFDVELRLGAGAFVCGEETALIASIEGRRGTPRPRPPYPASYGLWGRPTLINNVETFANIPWIMREGGEALSAIGTAKSKGTKVFALAGTIINNGLIEVPMGITLRDIIDDIGGGVPDEKALKAVQTGGPSGGCIPAELLDMPVDYESLVKAGSIMGSGGMIVMDETSNMVDVARFFMEFCKDESCGKCVPCRVGTSVMLDLLEKLCQGTASRRDLDLLKELCEVVRCTSLCGLGQTAPNPVLSTLRYFEHEYTDTLQPADPHGYPLPMLQTS
ncbi:MAG: NADH-quinone oxidoreductase subunit NuoF [Planctomycetota bacterium]